MYKKIIKKGLFKLGYRLTSHKNEIASSHSKTQDALLKSIIGANYNVSKYHFCRRGLPLIQNLITKANAFFSISEDRLQIEVNGLKYYINSWEELLILDEVFCQGVYNVEIPDQFIAIDVGMNVGIASLFFASKDNCVEIRSFEPFETTIEKALENFAINNVSQKIQVHNYGLGFPAREIEVNYSEEYKGSVGINGIATYIEDDLLLQKSKLIITDAYSEFCKIIQNKGSNKIIAKIDCEGAEYEIIECLDSSNLLGCIDVYIIEWHYKGAKILKDIFLRNNFRVFESKGSSVHIGVIYCYK